MLKMADACADASKQTRFHEMHVQRHNNVSILYADIVNFTPLSERLSASDLVKTLNELFGRFDQIAQVSFKLFSWLFWMQVKQTAPLVSCCTV